MPQNQHTPRLRYLHLRSPSTPYLIISSPTRPCINFLPPLLTSSPHHSRHHHYCLATTPCWLSATSPCRVAVSHAFALSSRGSRSWSILDNSVCSHSQIPLVNNPLLAAQTTHKLSGVSVRLSTFSDMSVSAQTGNKLSGVSIGLYHFIMCRLVLIL